MNDLRCSMCGAPLTQEEIDKQEIVFMATAIGRRLIVCDRDYKRVLHIFEKDNKEVKYD